MSSTHPAPLSVAPSRGRRWASLGAVALPWIALLLLVLLLPNCKPKATNTDVLVVVNGRSPVSVATGHYYAERRGVPIANIVTLSNTTPDPELGTTGHETVSQSRFDSQIRGPLESFLVDHDLVDQIRIIVLAPGVPHRVSPTSCPLDNNYLRDCPRASVDAELAVLFSDLVGVGGLGADGEAANPYYDSDQPFAEWRDDNPDAPLRYLVARLGGYQTDPDGGTGVPADVKALIDRARQQVLGGQALLDEDPTRSAGLQPGNLLLLHSAAAALGARGMPLLHDQSNVFVSDAADVVAYGSWGSNDGNDPGEPFYGSIGGQLFPGTFLPKSVVVDNVSTNARSFVHPPGYGQSLVADLVRLGATGVAGNVFEPLLSGLARTEVLFRHYFEGASAIESYYRSVPYLSWMNVWVGDPLMHFGVPLTAPADSDGDGTPDASDNCIRVPNADQRDTDGDGFGNLCDGDVNNDGRVTSSWGVTFPPSQRGDVEEILLTIAAEGYDADHDLDGDGVVDDLDASLATLMLYLPLGPSGLVP
jgi:uncharacterized protein (TIGR03790 family)